MQGKGFKEVQFAYPEDIDAKINRWIESGNETERTAARCMKAMVPLLKEIIHSGDLHMVSGFAR